MNYLFSVLIFLFVVQNPPSVDGIYRCDNKLKVEELRIEKGVFTLAHLSHIDGKYLRKGKIKVSGDTVELLEESNTIVDSTKNIMEFHSKFVLKDNLLFVIFKDKTNRDFIQNSPFNFTKAQEESLLKQDWVKE